MISEIHPKWKCYKILSSASLIWSRCTKSFESKCGYFLHIISCILSRNHNNCQCFCVLRRVCQKFTCHIFKSFIVIRALPWVYYTPCQLTCLYANYVLYLRIINNKYTDLSIVIFLYSVSFLFCFVLIFIWNVMIYVKQHTLVSLLIV